MARPKPTAEDIRERIARAKEWREWMKENLFTEKKLADVLGISRRTIQMIKAGKVSPYSNTLLVFKELKKKYAEEADRPRGDRTKKRSRKVA